MYTNWILDLANVVCSTVIVIYFLLVIKQWLMYWLKYVHEEQIIKARNQQEKADYNERLKKESDFAKMRFEHEERLKTIDVTKQGIGKSANYLQDENSKAEGTTTANQSAAGTAAAASQPVASTQQTV